MGSSLSGGRWFENYVIRNREDEIVLGQYAKLEQYLEQSWSQVGEPDARKMGGLRIPTLFKASANADNPGIDWYDLNPGGYFWGLCDEREYRRFAFEQGPYAARDYHVRFQLLRSVNYHEYQHEIFEERYAKTLKGFVADVRNGE